MMKNEMKLSMDAISENEALGRICIATFLTRLHPTLEELEDVKTAVSEAITNAIIHGVPADGKVYITCRCEKDIFHVEIEDHGVGIAAEELDHVWDRYYKASSNMVRATEGSGLGLSIVKEILTLHKVNYGVESTLGSGTTFWFELNYVKTEKEKPAAPALTDPASGSTDDDPKLKTKHYNQ